MHEARREESRRAAQREARNAYRRALRVAGYQSFAEHEARYSFPCAQLCDGCGVMRWPEETTAGDPHRRLPNSGAPRCAHCGGARWIDLQQPAIANALVQSEAFDRTARRGLPRRVAGLVTAVGVTGLALYLAVNALLAFGLLVFLFGFAGLCVIASGLRFDVGKRKLPRRWSMALPPVGATHPIASDEVRTETTLVAPLSGRPCVAYEIGVRDDARPRAALGTWSLVEQRNVALAVGDAQVEPNALHLELPRELAVIEDPTRTQQYLRERGLDPHTAGVTIYETIVAPEATLQLHATANGALVATLTRAHRT